MTICTSRQCMVAKPVQAMRMRMLGPQRAWVPRYYLYTIGPSRKPPSAGQALHPSFDGTAPELAICSRPSCLLPSCMFSSSNRPCCSLDEASPAIAWLPSLVRSDNTALLSSWTFAAFNATTGELFRGTRNTLQLYSTSPASQPCQGHLPLSAPSTRAA